MDPELQNTARHVSCEILRSATGASLSAFLVKNDAGLARNMPRVGILEFRNLLYMTTEHKIVLGGAGIILAALVVLALTSTPSPTTEGHETPSADAALARNLVAEHSTHDFGAISMAKGKVNKSFAVKNTSQQPITITKIFTSCMCTVASIVHEGHTEGPFGMPGHGLIPSIDIALTPGKTAEVEVTFDPAAHGPAGVGPIAREIYVDSSAGRLTLSFTAQVTP